MSKSAFHPSYTSISRAFVSSTHSIWCLALLPLLLAHWVPIKASEPPRFELIQAALTWEEAKADAEARGGHLATFTSQVELDAFFLLVKDWPPNFWVGGYQNPGSLEPEQGWKWVTGEEWSFTAWGDGEPNNFIGFEEDALSILKTGFWNDAANTSRYSYAIEYEVANTATAVAEVSNGFLINISLVNPGFGYKTTPRIHIFGGGGSGAMAEAKVSNGIITQIVVLNTGNGYTSLPDITIDSVDPPPHELSIRVSKLLLDMKVVVGGRYQLESSENMTNWILLGDAFIADTTNLSQEVMVTPAPKYYRLRKLP
jgi:hypothetical protein